MKTFNILVFFNHKEILQRQVFLELALLIKYSLEELGLEAKLDMESNTIDPSCRNILVGIHTFPPRMFRNIPGDTIGVNTEQLLAQEMGWDGYIQDFSKKFEVWDYCPDNVYFLEELGALDVKYLRLGYCEKLHKIPSDVKKDIDVLMYGTFNEKRTALVKELRDRGYRVEALHKVFGDWRDSYIARSKIILNSHYFKSQIFESVRVFYLMTNGKAVVTEVNSTTSIDSIYMPGICGVPYPCLVDACANLLENEERRLQLEQDALSTIQALPMAEWMLQLI